MLGVLGGHAADYAALFPNPAERNGVLNQTGHGWLSFGAETASLLVAVAISGVLARIAVPWVGRSRSSTSLSGFALRLAGWQALIFASLEISERLARGAPISDLFHGPLLATGVAVQVPVAFVVAVVVALLHVLCSRMWPSRHARLHLAVIALTAGQPQSHPVEASSGSRSTRGPPLGAIPA